jgi:glycine cleavage system transcriptional repressor
MISFSDDPVRNGVPKMTTLFKNAYVLNVMSDDHPGIVAAVGAAVSDSGGNIDNVSQTVLEGYFTLIMIVSFPKPIDPDALAATVQKTNDGFQVVIRPFTRAGNTADEHSERFIITAFGKDCPGIVLHFSQYLAGKDINIIDLFGSRRGKDEFVLIGEVEVSKNLDLNHLQADLEEMGRDKGYTVRLQHENIFVATNQLRLTRGAHT